VIPGTKGLNLDSTGAAKEYVLRQKLFQIPCGKIEDTKTFWEETIAYFPLTLYERKENDVPQNSSIVACVFVAAVTFLPSLYLATIEG
jgi:hypothetical protein